MEYVTAMANKSGSMDPDTRVNGAMARPTGKESCITRMAIFMKVTGSTTKLTVRESTPTPTEPDIRVRGAMISSMVTVWRPGLTAQSTRESTMRAKRMAQESSLSQMVQCTRVTLK